MYLFKRTLEVRHTLGEVRDKNLMLEKKISLKEGSTRL